MYILAIVAFLLIITIVLLCIFLPSPAVPPRAIANLEIAAGSELANSGLVNDRSLHVPKFTQRGDPLFIAEGSHIGNAVAISFDGSTIASCGELNLSFYNGDGTLISTLQSAGNNLNRSSVAISANGTVCAVSSGSFINGQDVYYHPVVYRRANAYSSEWLRCQPIYLIGTSDSPETDQQGCSLAISYDGCTLAFGGKNYNNGIGAVWVFTFDGDRWSEQARLIGSGYIGSLVNQGARIGLSGDGNTLVVSGSRHADGEGAIWVFNRVHVTWSQTQMFQAPYVNNANQGLYAAISGDGLTLAFTANPVELTYAGVLYVWVFDGSKWVIFPGATQFYTDLMNGPLCINHDGSIICIARNQDWANRIVHVYQSDHKSPFTKIAQVIPSNLDIVANYGECISICDSKLVVGAPVSDLHRGAVVLFDIE